MDELNPRLGGVFFDPTELGYDALIRSCPSARALSPRCAAWQNLRDNARDMRALAYIGPRLLGYRRAGLNAKT
jgi:hypothetical protein